MEVPALGLAQELLLEPRVEELVLEPRSLLELPLESAKELLMELQVEVLVPELLLVLVLVLVLARELPTDPLTEVVIPSVVGPALALRPFPVPILWVGARLSLLPRIPWVEGPPSAPDRPWRVIDPQWVREPRSMPTRDRRL